MKSLFLHYYNLSNTEIAETWNKCVFVFDTNVLLDLYRIPKNASNDLLKILSDTSIVNRIWIPFQVGLEYQENRLNVITDQIHKFDKVTSLIIDAKNDFNSALDTISKKLKDLQLKERHSTINPDKYINKQLTENAINLLNDFEKELIELKKEQPDIFEEDKIREQIDILFNGKVGDAPLSQAILDEIYKEGEIRYKNLIPPGYKDLKEKKDKSPRMYNELVFKREYGDLIMWKEILNKVKNDTTIDHLIFVLGDLKEDWILEISGKKIGPRRELLQEIRMASGRDLKVLIYSTSNFMKYAKQYLSIDVEDLSIEQVKNIVDLKTYKSNYNEKVIVCEGNRDRILLQFLCDKIFKFYNKYFDLKILPVNYKFGHRPFIKFLEHSTHLYGHVMVVADYVNGNLGYYHQKFQIYPDDIILVSPFIESWIINDKTKLNDEKYIRELKSDIANRSPLFLKLIDELDIEYLCKTDSSFAAFVFSLIK